MKSHIKNASLFVFIISICLFRVIDYTNLTDILYLIGFIAATVVLYIIKNKYLALVLGIIILIASSLYDISCIVFSIPAFLLISVYRSAIPKLKQSDKKNQRHAATEAFFLQMLFLLGIAGVIYFFIRSINSDFDAYIGDFEGATLICLALIEVFAIGCFSKVVKANIKNIYKISTHNYSTLNLFNFIALFLFIITLLLAISTLSG